MRPQGLVIMALGDWWRGPLDRRRQEQQDTAGWRIQQGAGGWRILESQQVDQEQSLNLKGVKQGI